MLMPKKVKYRKVQKGKIRGISKGARTVAFGEYGLQAVEPVRLSAQQIEATRITISRYLKKEGKYFLRVFPDKPVTKKPAETRMGKGKGNVDHWVAVVKRGRIVVEIAGVDEIRAKTILRGAAYKLPMKTKFVKRGHGEEHSDEEPSIE
ncbi:MAG: 50S ribosomal protein L16 [Candidatus Dependentiae bacterium]|nr:50S ribosomal protein L16 [Candidatus Dependentiae bacterium]